MSPTNPGRKKRFLRIAVNDVEPFPAGQPVERPGKGKNIQVDRGKLKAPSPVNFVGWIRIQIFLRLFGIKNVNLAPLPFQSTGQLMHRDLAPSFKA